MATSPTDRLKVIKSNYIDALENEPHDLASATTAADVTAVQANVANARSTFFAAVAADLSSSISAVEDAYDVAIAAQKSVQDARDASESLAKILGKLKKATDSATTLLKKATK